MSKLNVYTDIYTSKLLDWAEKNKYKNKIYNKGYIYNGYYVEVENNNNCKESLSILLEEVILHKNPITRGYKCLCDNIKNSIFIPCRNDIYSDLSKFLQDNNQINIDGYISFRMDEYNYLVNLVLYTIVKKSFNVT